MVGRHYLPLTIRPKQARGACSSAGRCRLKLPPLRERAPSRSHDPWVLVSFVPTSCVTLCKSSCLSGPQGYFLWGWK